MRRNGAAVYQIGPSSMTQVVFARGGPVTLVNLSRDIAMVLSDAEGFDTAGQLAVPLDPRGSWPLDGKTDLWAATAGGTGQLAAMPGAASYSFPDTAVRIAGSEAASPNGILAPSTGTNLGLLMPLGAPFFQLAIELAFPLNTGTIPFASMNLLWYDAASQLLVDDVTVQLPIGNSVSDRLTISGPVQGDLLSILLANRDPAQTLSYAWSLSGTSHEFPRLRILEIGPQGVNGFSRPGLAPTLGNLGSTQAAAGLVTPVERMPAVWNGRAMLLVDNKSQANPCYVTLADPQSLYQLSGNADFAALEVAAGAVAMQEVALPNGPVLFAVLNTGSSGTVSPTVTMTKLEY